tara:strand:+ start:1045 stop:1275 length:231 start_codon:yes stop_codon:yes gene_type:complete
MAWIDLKVPWHNTDVNYCDVTGNLVVGKCWEFSDKETGEVFRVTDESVEELYYKLKKFRSEYTDDSKGSQLTSVTE